MRLTLSRLSTCSSVWLLSIILAYAASVSWIVLSYSLRDAILRARLSFSRDSRSVRIRRSFWILAFSSSSAAIDLLTYSRLLRKSSMHVTSSLL